MKIKRASKNDFTKKEQYKLIDGETIKMIDAIGMIITVDCWILYDDTNSKGMDVEILAILASDGRVYATISDTFKERFFRIYDFFGPEEFPELLITGGQSKAGRDYVSVTPA